MLQYCPELRNWNAYLVTAEPALVRAQLRSESQEAYAQVAQNKSILPNVWIQHVNADKIDTQGGQELLGQCLVGGC